MAGLADNPAAQQTTINFQFLVISPGRNA